MVNNTVNNGMVKHVVHTAEGEKEIIASPAGINDRLKTTAVAWVNNRPQKLEIEVINSAEVQNLPFVIESADKITETDGAVVVRARTNTREDLEKRNAQNDKNGDAR